MSSTATALSHPGAGPFRALSTFLYRRSTFYLLLLLVPPLLVLLLRLGQKEAIVVGP